MITVPGLYTVTVRDARQARSLNLGAPQALRIEANAGCCSASLTLGTTVANAGTIELTSVNGTAASTLVSGTLTNAGTISALAGTGGARNLAANTTNLGTLNWFGTLTGNLSNDGQFNPGGPLGTAIVSGSYTQGLLGTLNVEIGGTPSCTSFDALLVGGTATLSGTLNVDLADGCNPALAQQFVVISFGTLSGDFLVFEPAGGEVIRSYVGSTLVLIGT